MPRKKIPGRFEIFRGLWSRGLADDCPSDHFTDCLNTVYPSAGVGMRDSDSQYNAIENVVRMHLYKPTPPFTGTNVPRIIALKSDGDLVDVLLDTVIYSNVDMKDFGFVNFFGRCYISPSDGKVGLSGINVKVYDGTTFRDAAGLAPPNALEANVPVGPDTGIITIGTHLLSYAFETSSGFITEPAPFIALDYFGANAFEITVLPTGPAGTVARWLLVTKAIEFRADLGEPFDVSEDSVRRFPLFFAVRIGNNTTTTYSLSFYDENLIDSADYLYTRLNPIPAGVGLLDYKGRMISYGEFTDPSLVRVSEIGEPESFDETSGFIITDPSDNTGVRCVTEFRDNLFVFKRQRGQMTQDNQLSASTWPVVNFEKSIGTEQYGIAAVMDAKGSSSDGFLLASLNGLYFFNGVFADPELSYKILDLWNRINENYFHLVQVVNDPINARIYVLVPLDGSTTVSHIIFGDYSDGLDPFKIKWSLWEFANDPTSLLVYTDFTSDIPSIVTRISNLVKILTLNIGVQGSDDGNAIDSYIELPQVRLFDGISHFNRVRVRGYGPGTLVFTAYGEDKTISVSPVNLTINSATPGKEYAQLMNLVSEQCRLKVRCAVLNEKFILNKIVIEGEPLWEERPR